MRPSRIEQEALKRHMDAPNPDEQSQRDGCGRNLAEGEGFEPPSPCGLTDFKSAAFNRSANPPGLEKVLMRPHFSLRHGIAVPVWYAMRITTTEDPWN